jgi:hypothetical protein
MDLLRFANEYTGYMVKNPELRNRLPERDTLEKFCIDCNIDISDTGDIHQGLIKMNRGTVYNGDKQEFFTEVIKGAIFMKGFSDTGRDYRDFSREEIEKYAKENELEIPKIVGLELIAKYPVDAFFKLYPETKELSIDKQYREFIDWFRGEFPKTKPPSFVEFKHTDYQMY